MDQYSGKYFTQNDSKTATVHNRIGKDAIQLMDNRPVSLLQQKLSKTSQQLIPPTAVQKKTIPENSESNLSGENTFQTENHPPVQKQAVKTTGVIQLGRVIRKNNKKGTKGVKKHKRFDLSPLSEYYDIKNTISQKVAANKLYINKIKKQLEDDDDIAVADSYTYRLNKIKTNANITLDEIIALPPTKGRGLRSQTGERDKLGAQLRGYHLLLNATVIKLKKTFPMNAGGFGAKGRAHNVDTHVNPGTIPFGKALNNHYFKNITLNGISSNVNVYKNSPIAPKQTAGPLQILGNTYSKTTVADKATLINGVNNALNAINTPQNVVFRDTPVGRNRGEGQYKNMNNTNAAGYAWLIDKLGNQRWEWLHIRGAGLGGRTDSTNLVAGARDSNTHMIPFESNIRHLGTAIKKYPLKYSKLQVIWSVSGAIAKYAYKNIRIQWRLYKRDNSTKASGDVSFKPLNTGNNISKNEVDKIETLLNDIRSGL